MRLVILGLGAQMGSGLDTLFAKCEEVAFPESKQHEKAASRTMEESLPL